MGSFGFRTIVTTLQCYNNAEFPLEFPKQDFQCKIQFVRLLDWFSIVSVRSPIASSANLVRRIRTILLNEHLVTSKWIIWLKSILAGMNLQLSIFFSGSTSGSWRPFFMSSDSEVLKVRQLERLLIDRSSVSYSYYFCGWMPSKLFKFNHIVRLIHRCED